MRVQICPGVALAAMLLFTVPVVAAAQPAQTAGAPPAQQGAVPPSQPPAIDDSITAAESENEPPARRLVSFNEYEGRLGSIRVGFGLLFDYASFTQDDNSKEQVDLTSQWKYRDGRLILNGRLGFKRPTTWTAGIMYDADKDAVLMRMTGIMVAVPEIWGHIFVGRSKEGFSLNKVMNGYAGWGMERAAISDATLPILADGVKWLGYAPKARIIWNVGFYGDALSDGEGFSSYENQLAGRVGWVPVITPDGGNLVHLGVSGRYGFVNSGKLRLKSRPGAWAAPFFVDTGEFAADGSTMVGLEAYYRPGSLTMGGEYFMQQVDATQSGDPSFHGGEAFFSWLITGEVRVYNTQNGDFKQVSPLRTVFSGGPGAWEIVAHVNTVDLDSGSISGGKFWRFTPQVNWYLSDNVRLELAYGYGSLNRFGLVGKTHFVQTRIQMQL